MVRRAGNLAAALLACAAAACGGGDEPAAAGGDLYARAGAVEAHDAMLERLAEVARRTATDNRFLGDGQRRFLESRLGALASTAPTEQRFALLVELAKLDLRLGDTHGAIERLAAAGELPQAMGAEARGAAEVVWRRESAIAHLRLGENENCIHCTHGLGCLFPIQPEGVHTERAGSEAAREHLLALVEHPAADTATRLVGRWLLNVAAMTLGEHPGGVPEAQRIDPALFETQVEFPWFRQVASEKGIDTLSNSGAAVAEDFDGDGDFDLLTGGFELAGTVRYFRNDGRANFEDRTVEAGLEGYPGGLNMIHGDVDNDGDSDVLVLRGAWLAEVGRQPNSLLANDGTGRFRDVTLLSGLGDHAFPTQTAAFADYDNDGDLDLYIGNEDFPSELWRNRGDGTFEEVAAAAGVENRRYAKAVTFGDVDGDGWPDLYVSNFKGKNRLYKNQRDGTFVDVAEEAGVTEPLHSFPAWFWDFDGDGVLDLFVSAYVEDVAATTAAFLGLPSDAEPGRLYKGDGAFGFTDVHAEAGLTRHAATMGANFGDLDNDGRLDMYLGTGWPAYEALVPNVMYWNQGGRFVDVSTAGGFGHLQKGHAVVFADFDRDGDQDVFEQMGGAYKGDAFHDAYFENPGFGNAWISVKVEGTRSNRSGIGARIRATFTDAGRRRTLHRWVGMGGSFGSNPLEQHFGLGRATKVDRLEVFWPTSGITDVLENLEVGRVHRIREGEYAR